MASTATTKERQHQRISALISDDAPLEWSESLASEDYEDANAEPFAAEFAMGNWRRHAGLGFSAEIEQPSAMHDFDFDLVVPGLAIERAGWPISAIRDRVMTGESPTATGRTHFSRALDADDATCARILTSAKVVDQPTALSDAAARNAVSVLLPAAWTNRPPTIMGQGLASWSDPFSTYVGQSFDFLPTPDVLSVPDVYKVPHHHSLSIPHHLMRSSNLWLDEAERNKAGVKFWADLFPRVHVLDLVTRVAHHLARIPQMVKASDSVLPSPDVIGAAQTVAGYLSPSAKLPQIEIDDSNGAISFVWRDQNNAFALEIPSARYVIGIGFGNGFAGYRPWRHLVTEERKIITEIEASETVRKLLGSE